MIWIDRSGNVQKTLGFPNNFGAPTPNGRFAFGATVDIAKNLPENAGAWNDTVEAGRQKVLSVAAINPVLTGGVIGLGIGGPPGAIVGAGVGATVLGIDKVSGGAASEFLMLAPKN